MRFVSKIALGAAALLAMGGTAMAADLMAPPPPAAAVTSGWDGLYIGAQGSYANDPTGSWVSGDFIVGGNLTVSDSFLLGLEGGLGGYYLLGGGGTGSEETIAVRAGFIAGGSTLLYGVVGDQWYNFTGSGSPFIGGGIEFKASDQMSVRVQAVTFGSSDFQLSTGVFWHMQ